MVSVIPRPVKQYFEAYPKREALSIFRKHDTMLFVQGIPYLSNFLRALSRERRMKQGIHPTYHEDAVITCACGEKYVTGSTVQKIEIEICAKCHPYYTGKKKYIDTTGRVERFKQLAERAKEKQAVAGAGKKVRVKKSAETEVAAKQAK